MKAVIATSNQGKLREFKRLFDDIAIEIEPQSKFNVPDAIEDGLSFVENALIKARHASRLTNLPSIADDSGLEVDYLKGAPGIYSSRFAGNDATDEENISKLLLALNGVPFSERIARYQCVIVKMDHPNDPTPIIAQGSWEGSIALEAKGHQGFGYDPIFYIPELKCTSAELTNNVKNKISHRSQAMAVLLKKLYLISNNGLKN
jgi:XTP/dITP diphosphohydrolase|tara:strand:- start:9471 stop:10082 length:612 start_codon:yes stop_codon:yes gene_type:complete